MCLFLWGGGWGLTVASAWSALFLLALSFTFSWGLFFSICGVLSLFVLVPISWLLAAVLFISNSKVIRLLLLFGLLLALIGGCYALCMLDRLGWDVCSEGGVMLRLIVASIPGLILFCLFVVYSQEVGCVA